MKVQILKTHYRFQMHSPYNHKVLKVVKKIQKRYYNRIEIKFSKFIEEFKKYLEFSGRRYNSAERKITMPKEHLEKVLLLSKEIGFEIVITDEILVE